MKRTLLTLLALAAIALYSGISLQRYLGRGWAVPSETLREQADRSLREGVAKLSDTTRSPAERFDGYQRSLADAQRSLVASLDRQPAQAQLVARIATIELEQNSTDVNARSVALQRVEIASRLAPHVPRVQAQLGELLLRMGYVDEALRYLGSAAALDPSYCSKVVTLGSAFGVDLPALHEILPNTATALTALGAATSTENRPLYLSWVERAFAEEIELEPSLFTVYLNSGIASQQTARVVTQLQTAAAPAAAGGDELEGARLYAIAGGQLALGQLSSAAENAAEAQQLNSANDLYAERRGDIALARGEYEQAASQFQRALNLIAKRRGSHRMRGHYYRRLGQAYDGLDRFDDAYDAYKRALESWPEEPFSRRRLEQLAPGSTSGLQEKSGR